MSLVALMVMATGTSAFAQDVLNQVPTATTITQSQADYNYSNGGTQNVKFKVTLAPNTQVGVDYNINKPTSASLEAKVTVFNQSGTKIAVGLSNVISTAGTPNLYVVGELPYGKYGVVGGASRATSKSTKGFAGLYYQLKPNIRLQADYLPNSTSFGAAIKYGKLEVTPAILVSNRSSVEPSIGLQFSL